MSRIETIEILVPGPPGGGLSQTIADTLYPAKGPTETAINVLQQGVTRKNLRSEGFALDGSDESASMQALATNDPAGTVYVIPDGATLGMGSTQLSITGKPHMRIEGYEGAIMQWTAPLATPLIAVTSSDHFGMHHVAIVGGETTFVGTNSDQYALDVNSSDHAVLDDVTVSGVSRGLILDGSDHATVRGFDYTGLLTAHVTNANYHTALFVNGSDHAEVANLRARDCGSAVLSGLTSLYGTVTLLNAVNTYDNGVYISGGEGWEIVAPKIVMEVGKTQGSGSGVKLRGSNNACLGGYVEGVDTGYVLTGNGGDDGTGYNGHGSKLIGVRARATRLSGALIDVQDGFEPRDFHIVASTFEGCGTAVGGDSSVRVISGDYHKLIGITVANQLSTGAGILIGGASGNLLTGIELLDATVRNQPAAASAYGMQGSFVDRLLVDGLTLHNIPGTSFGMRLITATNSRVSRVRPIGTAGTANTIRINDAASAANRIIDNPGTTISDLGTGTVKPQTYAVTNGTTDRGYDADTVTTAELADVVGTLISDLRAQGVVG